MVKQSPILAWIALSVGACAARHDPDPVPAVTTLSGARTPWTDLLSSERATLLVFATTWCEACRTEQPAIERYAAAHQADTRTVVVFSGSSRASVGAIVAQRHLALESVVDTDGQLARHLGIERTPTLVWFGADRVREGVFHSVDELPAARVEVEDNGRELGTSYNVSVVGRDVARARVDLADARQECRRLEALLSEWRDDSDIARVNREAAHGVARVDGEMRRLLKGALHTAEVTAGAFDPTWRPFGVLWDAAERDGAVPTPERLEATRAAVGWTHVMLDASGVRFDRPDVQLGIAAFAKGWIVDAIFHRLRERGYRDILVNIGGDLRTGGRRADGSKQRIRILDPADATRVVRSLVVEDIAVATSGNYFRFREIGGQRYGHIIDPRSGRPPAFDGSVTVLTRDAAMADALATALFVMGPDDGLRFAQRIDGVDVVYVTRDGLRTTLASP